ncbi:DMT family transporter [Aquabacterium sp. OR-4]|uniref:DMT family transporter n=1 Tax=Aquabacterium sp. OR-4 TaxID=2978127 RepID=UPI0021B3CE0C|nr:DMT family transporter [Aquabacterium sp. OR-4]MDT7834694.1 DMT family transporter [Aquabacterium sp. OR-4]
MKSAAPHPHPPLHAYALLAASMALVGSYVGLSRLLVAVFPVFLLAWLRFGIAAVAMAHWVKRGADEPALSAHDRKLLFWESFLGNFLFSICMLFGVQLTSALSAGVVMAAIPAAVAILSRLFLAERISRRVAASIACAGLGITLLALARAPAAPADPSAGGSAALPGAAGTGGLWGDWGSWLGHVLLLCAVFCEAAYVVIGKRLTGRVSPRRISALINLWGLALVTPFGLWQALQFDFRPVPGATWALLLFYALAASVATVWLWMKGLLHVPAPQAGVFTVCLPIAAAAVGVGLLGEAVTPLHGVALVLALTGLVMATWPARGRQGPQA